MLATNTAFFWYSQEKTGLDLIWTKNLEGSVYYILNTMCDYLLWSTSTCHRKTKIVNVML